MILIYPIEDQKNINVIQVMKIVLLVEVINLIEVKVKVIAKA